MEVIERLIKEEYHIRHSLLILRILLQCRHHENQYRRMLFAESKLFDVLKLSKQLESNDNMVLYNQIVNDYETIKDLIADLKGEIYSHFKAAILVILDHKTNDELVSLSSSLNELLTEYHDLEKASNDVYYHSGEFLSLISAEIVKYIDKYSNDKTKKVVPYEYFKQQEVIISFTTRQWMQFYNNTRFTLKYLAGVKNKEKEKITELFLKLEFYYFLIIACFGDE